MREHIQEYGIVRHGPKNPLPVVTPLHHMPGLSGEEVPWGPRHFGPSFVKLGRGANHIGASGAGVILYAEHDGHWTRGPKSVLTPFDLTPWAEKRSDPFFT
jgi:hypothetical protein